MIDSARRGQVEASARRKLHLEPLVLDDADIQRIEEVAEAADLAETVRATLSATEYEALRARAVDEESYAELALRLRCSEAVARKRVSRAIANVRTVIEDGDELISWTATASSSSERGGDGAGTGCARSGGAADPAADRRRRRRAARAARARS